MKPRHGWLGLASLLFAGAALALEPAEDLSQPIFDVHPEDYCKQSEETGEWAGPFTVAKGHNSRLRKFDWGQGGGCIFRPIREAWGVLHNQPVMVWGGVDESKLTIGQPVPGATHLYKVQYIVKDFITVKWTMDWHHALPEGSFAEPKRVVVNYRKVSGTSYIPYWEGTVVLRELAPGVTGFAARNQVDAAQTDEDDAAETVQDIFGKVGSAKPDFGPIPTPEPASL